MPKRYSAEAKRLILERLAQNNGNVLVTADETGVNPRTIYIWLKDSRIEKKSDANLTNLTNLVNQDAVSSLPADLVLQPGEVADVLRELQQGMIQNVRLLNDAVAPAIADATLAQRVAALTQLTDRIIRLNGQLPQPEAKPDPNADDGTYEMEHPIREFYDEKDQDTNATP